jgi:hypothetical protein
VTTVTSSPTPAVEHRRRAQSDGEERDVNGNIDEWLDIAAGDDATVMTTGWIDFQANDPDSVQVWVGVSQGDKKNNTAVYGEGWVTVHRPGAGNRTSWQCRATINGQAGAFKNGPADAGAVVIEPTLEPYPWGRGVKLQK